MTCWQTIIQVDNGDELWVDNSKEFESRTEAKAWAQTEMAARCGPSSEPTDVTYTAFIYEGKMVDMGDETDSDWVFEADPTIEGEVIHDPN